MNTIKVIYYSNYYPKSVEIKEYMENDEHVRTLNVDNKDVSKAIIADTVYGIRHVPSILLLNEDGSMKIYEKDAAVLYFEELKQKKENPTRLENQNSNVNQFLTNSSVMNANPYTVPQEQQPVMTELESQPQNFAKKSIMDMAREMENGRN